MFFKKSGKEQEIKKPAKYLQVLWWWGEQDLNLSAETRISAAKSKIVKSDCHDFATDL